MNDIEIIKDIIYSDNGAKMEYIDIDNILDNECENFIQAIENLIQRNKDLEQILELTSKSLDNISYDQIPIAIQELLNLYNKEKERNKDLEQTKKEDLEMLNEGWKIECEKKDKIINLMAEHIEKGCDFDNRIQTKQQILEYFKNKVEEDTKE